VRLEQCRDQIAGLAVIEHRAGIVGYEADLNAFLNWGDDIGGRSQEKGDFAGYRFANLQMQKFLVGIQNAGIVRDEVVAADDQGDGPDDEHGQDQQIDNAAALFARLPDA